MSSYSCVNQGHCHPKILAAMVEQAKKLTITSFGAANDQLGPVSKHLTTIFKYDKIIFMNSGYEAVDTATLLARKWGYQKKKIQPGKAKILFPKNCYWGMMTAARVGCDDPTRKQGFEPNDNEILNFDFVEYNNVDLLEAKFKADPNICAFLFEPVQGHAGIIYPDIGYYSRIRELCTKYNVLMVSDDVQAGLGRCGKLLTTDWENVRPDIVTLGKSLSGGFMPISAVLGDNEVMNVWSFGEHVSTYASNPLAMAVTRAAVDVLIDEGMLDNSEKMGKVVELELKSYKYNFIQDIQCGKGLFTSIQLKDELAAWTIAHSCLTNGLLLKPDAEHRIKIMPPLCITEITLKEGLAILKRALDDYEKKGKFSLIA
jgi:ornithine--oxo-acid transaminase